MSTATDTAEIPVFEPKVIDSASYFYRDDTINSDKEYHAQLIQIAEKAYQVDYQFGKRGSSLNHKVRISHCGLYSAQSEMRAIADERSKKNYRAISLDGLEKVYGQMKAQGLDNAGLDLFVDIRGKVVSLADYARKAGSAAKEQYPIISSYNAASAIGAALGGILGNKPSDEAIDSASHRVNMMLTTMDLRNVGIFVGKTDGGKIFRWSPVGFDEIEDPADSPKKKKGPRP
jgi:hypothetical protein